MRDARTLRMAVVCLFLAVPLQGCDEHHDARREAVAQLTGLRAEVDRATTERQQRRHEREALQVAWRQVSTDHERAVAALVAAKGHLLTYVAQNKAAVAAIAVTGAGALSALSPEARSALAAQLGDAAPGLTVLAGIAGAGYCLFSEASCAAVAAQLAALAGEIEALEGPVQRLAARRTETEQTLKAAESTLAAAEASLGSADMAVRAAQERVDALKCTSIWCSLVGQ